jgi:hypothetical protein
MSYQYCSDTLRLIIGMKVLDSWNQLRQRRLLDVQPLANLFLLHSQLEVLPNNELTVRARDIRAPRQLFPN